MKPPAPRSREQRKRDTMERLRNDLDLWIASASEDGDVHLIPLSFHWVGEAIIVATPRASRTARNLTRAGTRRRAGVGTTRDVVMIDGIAEGILMGADPDSRRLMP